MYVDVFNPLDDVKYIPCAPVHVRVFIIVKHKLVAVPSFTQTLTLTLVLAVPEMLVITKEPTDVGNVIIVALCSTSPHVFVIVCTLLEMMVPTPPPFQDGESVGGNDDKETEFGEVIVLMILFKFVVIS